MVGGIGLVGLILVGAGVFGIVRFRKLHPGRDGRRQGTERRARPGRSGDRADRGGRSAAAPRCGAVRRQRPGVQHRVRCNRPAAGNRVPARTAVALPSTPARPVASRSSRRVVRRASPRAARSSVPQQGQPPRPPQGQQARGPQGQPPRGPQQPRSPQPPAQWPAAAARPWWRRVGGVYGGPARGGQPRPPQGGVSVRRRVPSASRRAVSVHRRVASPSPRRAVSVRRRVASPARRRAVSVHPRAATTTVADQRTSTAPPRGCPAFSVPVPARGGRNRPPSRVASRAGRGASPADGTRLPYSKRVRSGAERRPRAP